ncbi:MAG: RHS repeat domain-containing protein, partial [Flavobacterium sp.]
QLERGAKRYELANHLGNVLTVISDKKTAICTGNTFNYFAAERISATDYSPFGAPLAGRSWNGGEYRFGFNSMEKDNEINGSGNAYDFGARIYDGRLGRWMSVDPLERHYACWSTYNSFMCNPIFIIDPDGKGGKISKVRDPRTGKVVAFKVTAVIYIYSDVKSASELGELSVEIETNIEGNWNNVYSSENSVPCNYLIDGKPLIFDVEVVPITREEAVEKMNDSKTQLDENFVEIVDNTSRPSEFNYNSGVFNVCQQESDKTTYAHEFGHMLEYAIEKIKVNSDGEVINEIGDNPKLYHTKVETTYATMMRIADALDANKQRERKVTNMDVRGLDRGFGLENAIITKNLEIVKESKFIGKEKRADSYIEYKNGAKVEK